MTRDGAPKSGVLYVRLGGREIRLPAILWMMAFVLVAAAMVAATLVSLPLPSDVVVLREGQVSPGDIRAPERLTYTSSILTERARDQAAFEVDAVFDAPDSQVAREQMKRVSQILIYMDAVRSDGYSTIENKEAMLGAIEDLRLSSTTRSRILDFSADDWRRVADEAARVLDQSMRREIRVNELAEARRRTPTLIGLDLNEAQAGVIVEVVQQLVQPNSMYNAELTASARQRAREAVEPVSRSWEQDEIVLRQGEIVDELTLEALDGLGFRQPQDRWPQLVGTAVLALVLASVLGLYLVRLQQSLHRRARLLILLLLLNGVFLLGIRFMIPGHTVLPYLFPLAAVGILLSVLIDPYLAIMIALLLSTMAGFMAERSLEVASYLLLGSIIGVLQVQKVERLNTLILAAVSVAVVNVALVLSFRLPAQDTDLTGLLTLAAAGTANGAFSASLSLAGFFLLGQLFDVITPLQLLELARPDHPLLQQLLLQAPGTYHHSLLVSNLAEQAAQAIGADALLTRVGAYYHDVGKSVRPYFFVENQVEGMNVHDRLDPRTSAQIVLGHVTDGLALAKKYRLPSRISAFIAEHHGDSVNSFFYHSAKRQAGDDQQVSVDDYRYLGPKPQSKETAIVMLADSCEAAARASQASDPEEIAPLVDKIVQAKIAQGNLDDCYLTLSDLAVVRGVFTSMLQGIRHPRIEYPEGSPSPSG